MSRLHALSISRLQLPHTSMSGPHLNAPARRMPPLIISQVPQTHLCSSLSEPCPDFSLWVYGTTVYQVPQQVTPGFLLLSHPMYSISHKFGQFFLKNMISSLFFVSVLIAPDVIWSLSHLTLNCSTPSLRR